MKATHLRRPKAIRKRAKGIGRKAVREGPCNRGGARRPRPNRSDATIPFDAPVVHLGRGLIYFLLEPDAKNLKYKMSNDHCAHIAIHRVRNVFHNSAPKVFADDVQKRNSAGKPRLARATKKNIRAARRQ